jgi:hypothetical protein
MPAESVRKSPGFFDFSALIILGMAIYFKYFAAFTKNATCYSWRGPRTNLTSVPIFGLMEGIEAKSM